MEKRLPKVEATKTLADLAGLAEPPKDSAEALDQAKQALSVAEKLVKEHRANPKNDPIKARLRAGAELGWLAALSACQAILRHHGQELTSSADDVGEADKITKAGGTPEERAVVRAASTAVTILHAECFYRGTCSPRPIELQLEGIRVALQALKYSGRKGSR